MSIGQRIRILIAHLNLSDSDFANSIRYGNMKLSNIVNGVTKVPKVDFIANILSEYPNLNERWLILGEGEMWKDDNDSDESLKEEVTEIKEQLKVIMKRLEKEL